MGRFDDRATHPRRDFSDVLKWKLIEPFRTARPPKESKRVVIPQREPDLPLIQSPSASITWIGHASFLLTLGGVHICIDPVLAQRIGPTKRLSPPGINFGELPKIDIVIITHNHHDHLDAFTIKKLGSNPIYITPLGNGRVLKRLGAKEVRELDWWQKTAAGDIEVTIVPSRHWSMRTPWDRNETLWGGCLIQSADGTAYHSGDTGFFEGFDEIGQRAGAIDWAMLPIGAYEPRWFMEPQHMCPEESVRAYQMLRARHFLAMHWGTFRLTDEPVGEPPQRARKAWAEQESDESRLWILDVGETRPLSQKE